MRWLRSSRRDPVARALDSVLTDLGPEAWAFVKGMLRQVPSDHVTAGMVEKARSEWVRRRSAWVG